MDRDIDADERPLSQNEPLNPLLRARCLRSKSKLNPGSALLVVAAVLVALTLPRDRAVANIDVADHTLREPVPEFESFFGRSVAAGDVNGDGKEDILVGAPGAFVPEGDVLLVAGEAFVFLGGQPLDSAADFALRDPVPEQDARFGESVAMGDVDGDGKDDVIVGAFLSQVGSFSNAGEAFVFLGGEPFDSISDFTLQDPNPGAGGFGTSFGTSITTGDVNGDGKDDVIVGAPSSFSGGRALLFFGSAPFDNTADATLEGPGLGLGHDFGESVAAGDVNGDLKDDVIVGAPDAVTGGVNSGEAFVFLGGDPFNIVSDFILRDPVPEAFARFGNAVGAGDATGDGNTEVVVAALHADAGGVANPGEVFLFLGGNPFDNALDFTLQDPTPTTNGQFGFSIAAGDIDGDGKADFLLGANLSGVGGEAFIFLGAAPFNSSADLTLKDPTSASGNRFGHSVAAGDVNGDGAADAVVGADSSDVGTENDAGEAFVFLGVAALKGDVDCDGDVDSVDALFVQQFVVGLRQASNQCPPPEGNLFLDSGDVNGDTSVNAVDGLFILQCVAGIRSCNTFQLATVQGGSTGTRP